MLKFKKNKKIKKKKVLDLIECLKYYRQVHDIVQKTGIKTILKKKTYTKVKCLSEDALPIAVKRRGKRSEKQRRKGNIQTSECRVLKNSKKR